MPYLPEFHAYALKVPALEIFNDGKACFYLLHNYGMPNYLTGNHAKDKNVSLVLRKWDTNLYLA